MTNQYLAHHGVLGMRWGVRRYQNKDGSLTSAGKRRLDTARSERNQAYKIANKYVSRVKKKQDAELRFRRSELNPNIERNERLRRKMQRYEERSAKKVQKAEGRAKRYTDSFDKKVEKREDPQGHGLTDKQKTAIKVGVAVVGTALAVYGGYKVSKYLGARKAEARKAADIINAMKNAKVAADDSYRSPEMLANAVSRSLRVSAPNTRQITANAPARFDVNVNPMVGSRKMTDAEFTKAQKSAAIKGVHNDLMGQLKINQGDLKTRENTAQFWMDANKLTSRPDYEQVKSRAMKQYSKDLAAENKAYRKATEQANKMARKAQQQENKYYERLANQRMQQERAAQRKADRNAKKVAREISRNVRNTNVKRATSTIVRNNSNKSVNDLLKQTNKEVDVFTKQLLRSNATNLSRSGAAPKNFSQMTMDELKKLDLY